MSDPIDLPWTREELERAKALLAPPAEVPERHEEPIVVAARILLRPLVDLLLTEYTKAGR